LKTKSDSRSVGLNFKQSQ